MNHDELTKAYHAFFEKSEAGKYYVSQLNQLIRSAHENAENTPENARDYTQRAKGVREALDHITSVGAEIKKGRL